MADFMGPAWGELMNLLDAPVFAPITASIPANCPGVNGDPHVATLDGRGYDFQAAGEFVGLVAPDIEVQFRFEPWGSSDSVSITTGVAIDVAGSIVQVDQEQDGRVLIEGEQTTEPVTTLDSGGTVAISDDTVLVLWPEDQYRVGIDTQGSAMDAQVISTGDLAGQASGLLGDADGDADNDPSVDGEVIDPNDDDSLYGRAAEAWRVTDDNTLFTYADGRGPDSYWIEDFPMEPVDLDPEARRQAQRDCIDAGVFRSIPLRDCVLDVALTGDDSFIDSALARQGNPTSTMDQACVEALGPSRAVGRLAPDRRGTVPGPAPAGQVDWLAMTEGGSEIGGHVAGDEDVIVASGSSHLTALDAATGDVRWSLTSRTDEDVSGRRQPVLVGDLVITTNRIGHRLHLRENGTLCGRVHLGESDPTAPVVVSGRLVTIGTFGARAVVSVDLATGEHWVRPLVDNRSGVAVGGGMVLTSSEAGIVAIDAATGAVAWELERDGPLLEPPVLVGDLVVANDSSTGLFAVDLPSGDLVWEAEHEGDTDRDALAATDEIVVTAGSSDDLVVGADVTTGEQVWSVQLGDGSSAPVIVDGVAWVATREGLTGLSLADGSEVARTEGLVVKNMDGIPGGLVGGNAALDVIVIR